MTFPDPTLEANGQEAAVIIGLTVLGEAEGESELGKSAVAHVIVNRMKLRHKSAQDTCLAPWQFSCWNEGCVREQFLQDTIKKASANIPVGLWSSCWVAAHNALSGLSADPTQGATHYTTTNIWGVDDAKRKRPRWHSRQEIEAERTVETMRLGGHVFGRAA